MSGAAPTIGYVYDDVPTIAAWSEQNQFMLRGLLGPFGSGKSSGAVIELLKLAQLQPIQPDGRRHARFAVIRNTYVELRDTTIRTFMQWVPDGPGGFGTYTVTDHNYKITGIDGLFIEVMFRALDRPEQVKNLLSLEITAAWVNEAKEVPWPIIEALTGRVGRYPSRFMGGAKNPCIIMDTNPPDDESWWYDIFEVKKPKDAILFKQPSGRSPEAENLPNLPLDYYTRMAGLMDSERAKVYVDGQYGFIREGKPVYPDYADELHCIDFDVSEDTDRVYVGWDFGLQPAAVLSQIVDGQWRTFHEFTADSGEALDIYTFADTVINTIGREYPWIAAKRIPVTHIGDPSGIARSAVAEAGEAPSSFAVLHGKGIGIIGGDQSLTIRLGSVSYALKQVVKGRPTVLVHPRCKKLRRGYQGRYQYRRVAIAGTDNRYHDAPDKNEYSHPHDANQYIAAHLFGSAIKGRDAKRAAWAKPINYPPLSIR